MKRFVISLLLCLILVYGTGLVVGQQAFSDGFEDDTVGQAPDEWREVSDQAINFTVNGSLAGAGSKSFEITEDSNGRAIAEPDVSPLSEMPSAYSAMTYVPRNTAGGTDQRSFILIQDNDTSDFPIGIEFHRDSGSIGNVFVREDGNRVSIGEFYVNRWYNIEIRNVDQFEKTYTVEYWNSSFNNTETGISYQANFSDGYRLQWQVSNHALLDNVSLSSQTVVDTETVLDLQVNNYMEHGSKQSYTVYDESIDQDVTDSANVTSNNTDVITVNETTHMLVATNNTSLNERVNISAEFNGKRDTQNVTVANRTLSNIGILPPSTWVYAFLSGEDGLLGGETQWLYVAIILGAIASYVTRNNYIGIGAIAALNFLFWVGDYVSLGILLSSIFYVIFAAIVLADIDSQSPTVYVNR